MEPGLSIHNKRRQDREMWMRGKTSRLEGEDKTEIWGWGQSKKRETRHVDGGERQGDVAVRQDKEVREKRRRCGQDMEVWT
jgi:hypothetical protein